MIALIVIALTLGLIILSVLGSQIRTFTGTQISVTNEFPEGTTTTSENWFNFKIGDITGDITKGIKLRGANLTFAGAPSSATVNPSYDWYCQLHRVPEFDEERGLLFAWSGNNSTLITEASGLNDVNNALQMLENGDFFKLDPDDVIFVNMVVTTKDTTTNKDAIFRVVITLYYIPVRA